MEPAGERADAGRQSAEASRPTQEFFEQVKDALQHLHDLGYLQQHPLAGQGTDASQSSASIAGQRLRWRIVDAVEALSPGMSVPFCAPQARTYNLLTLHYVDGMTVAEAARELSISTRQAQRGLRQAERSLAAVLWARRSAPAPAEPDAADVTSLAAEMARLESHLRPIDVKALLQRALGAVEPLIARRRVRVVSDRVSTEPYVLSVDPVVAEQVLVSTLSRAVGQVSEGGALRLSWVAGDRHAAVALSYVPDWEALGTRVKDQVVDQLARRIDWSIRQDDQADGRRTITLDMTASGTTVLLIDDNEGLLTLLERFLSNQACRVIGAANGQAGLQMAQELVPDAIVLDVMMPGMHGWDVLQRLRTHPRTAGIPVIVCSVINNPELAQALGATVFLTKPVRQEDVLATLSQLGVV